MGVKELHQAFLLKEQHKSNLNDLGNGFLLGWDISGDLYKALLTIRSYEIFDSVPPVPLYNALNTIKKRVLTAKSEYSINLIPVFDGNRHPMKERETQDRKRQRAEALDELQKLYKSSSTTLKDVNAHRKAIVYPREDLLEMIQKWLKDHQLVHFCAPFEAEWELVYLEREGLLDGVLSADGDTFISGSTMQFTDVNWNTGDCIVYHRERVLCQSSIGGGGQ